MNNNCKHCHEQIPKGTLKCPNCGRWQANKSFLSQTVHEMRESITAISGYMELIKSKLKKEETDELKEYLDIVDKMVNNLRNTAQKLSDHSKND